MPGHPAGRGVALPSPETTIPPAAAGDSDSAADRWIEESPFGEGTGVRMKRILSPKGSRSVDSVMPAERWRFPCIATIGRRAPFLVTT